MSFRWFQRWSAVIALLCFAAPLLAAQTAPLRVDDVIRAALQKNPQVRAAYLGVEEFDDATA